MKAPTFGPDENAEGPEPLGHRPQTDVRIRTGVYPSQKTDVSGATSNLEPPGMAAHRHHPRVANGKCGPEGGRVEWRRATNELSLVRFLRPPVKQCMRFSRTLLTDIVHRQACAVP